MTAPAYSPMRTHLETGRLTLRPWTVRDAEQLRLLIGKRGEGEVVWLTRLLRGSAA